MIEQYAGAAIVVGLVGVIWGLLQKQLAKIEASQASTISRVHQRIDKHDDRLDQAEIKLAIIDDRTHR